MNQPTNRDDTLARLIREAADQTQPRPALDAIRARTSSSPKESAMTLARTWILGGLGGAVATAAVIGGVYFATTGGDGSQDLDPVDTPSVSGPVDPSPSVDPTDSESAPSPDPDETVEPGTSGAVPVYFVGDTPSGPRLYREFSRTSDGLDRVSYAATMAVAGEPVDPDYRSAWPAGDVVSVEATDDLITVDLSGDVHDRPSGTSEAEAQMAIEQVIYSVQGAFGKGRVPVQFLLDGKHADQVLGQPASEPLANGPVLKTLSHVNISAPSEGEVIDVDVLNLIGVANSFEANVVVKLQRFEGTHVVFQKPVTATGWMGEKLFPFAERFDISDVPAGKYILTASTDDPSGGAEGNGPYTDSKVITIK